MSIFLRIPTFVTSLGFKSRVRCRQFIGSLRSKREYNTNLANIDFRTNVVKDVILFKYENPKFYKYLNIFAIVQFLVWASMGKFTVSTLKYVPISEGVSKDLPWWQRINLGEGKYKHTLTTVCYFLGTLTLACSWIFTLRSVRYLILMKGGKKVSIVSYAPFGENRIMTVPLENVSCPYSRAAVKTMLPLKVKNMTLNYLMDARGEFRNPQLFDITAGMKRKL